MLAEAYTNKRQSGSYRRTLECQELEGTDGTEAEVM